MSAAAISILPPVALVAQDRDTLRTHYSATACPSCQEWNEPTAPRTLFANVHYVGTRGLSAILLTSDAGHILIDAGLPTSAPQIVANVHALGFRVADIRLILNSHAHYDHAGGVGAIQRASGARVAARPASAAVLERGEVGRDDPQYGIALPYPPVTGTRIERIDDGDTVTVGPLRVVAHATGGHTPGGTSWSWRSCDGATCLDVVYADSQTPVSADGFMYTKSEAYPNALSDFNTGHATLEHLQCEVILTPHPGASRLWERVSRMERAGTSALRDPDGCRRYAANAREQLRRRVARETSRDTAALHAALDHLRKDLPRGPLAIDSRSPVDSNVIAEVARRLSAHVRRDNMVACEEPRGAGRPNCRFRDGIVAAMRVTSATRTADDQLEARVWTTVQMNGGDKSWMYGRQYLVKLVRSGGRWVVTSSAMITQT